MVICKSLERDDARIESAEELRASKVDWAHILVKKSNQCGAATPLIARTFGGAVGDTSEDAPEEPPGHRAWVVGWRDARRGGAAEGQGTATEGQGTAIARGLRGKPARETRLATLETRVAGGEKIEKPDSAKAKPGRNPEVEILTCANPLCPKKTGLDVSSRPRAHQHIKTPALFCRVTTSASPRTSSPASDSRRGASGSSHPRTARLRVFARARTRRAGSRPPRRVQAPT